MTWKKIDFELARLPHIHNDGVNCYLEDRGYILDTLNSNRAAMIPHQFPRNYISGIGTQISFHFETVGEYFGFGWGTQNQMYADAESWCMFVFDAEDKKLYIEFNNMLGRDDVGGGISLDNLKIEPFSENVVEIYLFHEEIAIYLNQKWIFREAIHKIPKYPPINYNLAHPAHLPKLNDFALHVSEKTSVCVQAMSFFNLKSTNLEQYILYG